MSVTVDAYKSEIQKLPLKDRLSLIETLISSLDDLSPEENEALWLNEADRRCRLFKAGHIDSKTAETDIVRRHP